VAKWQSHWLAKRNHFGNKDLGREEYLAMPEKLAKLMALNAYTPASNDLRIFQN
jgi:hypothetical protein